ncbi:molybdopterin biosynthesis protein MoeB [bacterium BMS3Bbin02]|nr:molybdopterin biosynthesis protein MoeB [bacterium BMS3Bbin02]
MHFSFLQGLVEVTQISTAGLGDHSYIINIDGVAAIIDPQRDVARFEQPLEAAGLQLNAVFETHIHNDYLSGGAILASRNGARYVLPYGTGATVSHIGASDNEDFIVGDAVIRALHTPGHTHHHTSFALVVDGTPLAIFSGGSMLVGAVGRSDLLGPDHTQTLLESQYNSVRRIAADMADATLVTPTHGAGSFCAAGTASGSVSDIAQEKISNPALLAPDLATFKTTQLAGYLMYPDYYPTMAPVNRVGADPIDESPIPRLEATDRTGRIIDVRPREEFAACHITGSINMPMSSDVGTYTGWMFGNDEEYIFVASQDDAETVRLQFQRIGFDRVIGRIDPAGVTPALTDSGTYPTSTFADMQATDAGFMLDVRDPVEVGRGTIDGAINIHVATLADNLEQIPDTPIWTFCASGYRASIAASVLAAAGRSPVLVKDSFSAPSRATSSVETI